MSSVLICPNCKHKLANKLSLIVKSTKSNNSLPSSSEDIKMLPCPYCNYELMDMNELRRWLIKTLIIFLPLGIIFGQRDNGLLFIVPILLIFIIYAVIYLPLKSEVFNTKDIEN